MVPSLPRCASRCNCATSARSSNTWTELPGRSQSHPNLRPDEPRALIPQAARKAVVERRQVGALENLADNIAAVERCRIGDRGQKQRGLGPFLRTDHKGFCESPAEFQKSAALTEPGRNAARMQTRRGYTYAFKPPRQFAREQDVAQLGATIRLSHRPPARAGNRREVNAAAAMRPRGDRDHPRWRRGFKPVEEEVGQQERGEMVDRKGQLEAIFRQAVMR